MRCIKPATARSGMTLMELLVVMMIIATLASLVLSAVFTVRESQMKSFTESLVQKLASASTSSGRRPSTRFARSRCRRGR